MASGVQSSAVTPTGSPLVQLGYCLVKDMQGDCPGSNSSSGEFKQVPRPGDQPAEIPPTDGQRFSIGTWKAKLAQRVIDQRLAVDLQNSSYPVAQSGAVASDANAGDAEASRLFVGEKPLGDQSDDLNQWLVGVFEARDAGRTERTAVALKSLAQASERKRADDMLVLAREGILTLTREGWRMLQERDPMMSLGLTPPGSGPLPTPEQHMARSSRCPVYLLPRRGGAREEDCESGAASNADAETSATGCSPLIASRESSLTWSDAASGSDRLHSVLGVDDDLTAQDSKFAYGHRDDWELQYMLNGIFDEMSIRLESGTVQDLSSLLQGARVRVLEWTVRRWQSCHSQGT